MMILRSLVLIAAGAAIALPAGAQERAYVGPLTPAPANAFELTVGGAYAQGFGSLRSGVPMKNVSNGAFAGSVGIAHRATPHFGWGVSGQYQQIDAVQGEARSVAAGLDFTFHGSPDTSIDPWLQLGPGYRALWQTFGTAPTQLSHGVQLARLAVGLDLRAGSDVAIAPMVGGDVDVFLWQKTGDRDNVEIAEPRPSVFVYGGLQARFDMGGSRVYARSEPVIFAGR